MTHPFDEAAKNMPSARLSDAEKAEHLRMLATAGGPGPKRRGRRRIAIITLGAVAAAGIGVGTAAAFGVFSAAPTDRRIAHCYATADLSDPSNHTDFAVAVPPGEELPTLHDAAASALDVCTGAWMQGRFSSTDPKVSKPKPPPWNHPVPPLIACVLPSGEVGVFPGDATTCGALGLPVAELNP